MVLEICQGCPIYHDYVLVLMMCGPQKVVDERVGSAKVVEGHGFGCAPILFINDKAC